MRICLFFEAADKAPFTPPVGATSQRVNPLNKQTGKQTNKQTNDRPTQRMATLPLCFRFVLHTNGFLSNRRRRRRRRRHRRRRNDVAVRVAKRLAFTQHLVAID